MNCKPGDLAIIVRAGQNPLNLGKIVQVLRLARPDEFCDPRNVGGAAWIVRCDSGLRVEIYNRRNEFLRHEVVTERPISDHLLRPIRPTDGEDEILRIAGRPETSHA